MARNSKNPDLSGAELFLLIFILAIPLFIIQSIVVFLWENPIILIFCIVLASSYPIYRLIIRWLAIKYFDSQKFQESLKPIRNLIAEYNDISKYIDALATEGALSLGGKTTNYSADIVSIKDKSRWNFRRPAYSDVEFSEMTHHCSLQIVRNVQNKPFYYLLKYFNIPLSETTLEQVQKIIETLCRITDAMQSLKLREQEFVSFINPPFYIKKYYLKEFLVAVNIEVPEVKIPIERYKFLYVSPAGNASQEASIELKVDILDHLVQYLDVELRRRKDQKYQRSLMTSKLRHYIKNRDNYTCKQCGVSVYEEPHLLLEVDHIIPVSKGGLTEPENLQTLCWSCNRSKSNKII